MTQQFVLGLPANILNMVQDGLLERAFHDALIPAFLFREEAGTPEPFPGQIGVQQIITRRGTLAPVEDPIAPGTDPVPQSLSYEQWKVTLRRYAATIDTNMPSAVVANSNLFMSNIQALGVQAGQSLNRIPRNALFKAYMSGNTTLLAATATTDTTIRVASINGFIDVVSPVRPMPVTTATPLQITIWHTTPIVRNVVAYTPDDPNDLYGPGTLFLSATVGSIVAARAAVTSVDAPRVIRVGGGRSVDAIGPSDTLTIQDIVNVANFLRDSNVQPHDDGTLHAHIPPIGSSQFFADPAFQSLFRGRPEAEPFKSGFLGELMGVKFYANNESPRRFNSGNRTSTGVNAFYSKSIGAETTNEGGVDIGRVVVTGKGAMYEKQFDEKQFVTEAGTTGKIGDFVTVNNGVKIDTSGVQLILRAPLNRLQDAVAASWSYSGDFPIPSDVTGQSGPQRFKRAAVIEFALSGA